MLYKNHVINEKHIIALCDDDLVGKTLKDERIEIFINPEFYAGETYNHKDVNDIKKIKTMLENAFSINAIGHESVSFLLDLGLIDESKIIRVQGIPHAMVLFMK